MSIIRKFQMLVDGKWVDAADGNTFNSTNPATGKIWAQIPEATAEDVDRAVTAAHRAFNSEPWFNMSATERGHCLRRLADLLVDESESLGRYETIDSGKLYKETSWQVKYVAEYYYFFAGCADKILGDTLPIDKPDMFVFTRREPIGVIAAVTPWNSPLFLSAIKIGPALAAGNTIVLKPSEHASVPLLEFGRLIEKAGIPPGVVNIVTGHGVPCGKSLTSHPLISRIAFTGGLYGAKQVIQNSQNNLAELSLELGGKSPFIVFEDADIEGAVNGALGAIFGASGQSCVAGSRLYLQAPIADEFLQQMVERAKQIRIGDPLDEGTEMGPLCTVNQLSNIKKEVSQAKADGAHILCGGNRVEELEGNYYEPTIIECSNHDARIMDTELFGPVLAVYRFKDEEEAVRLANDTKHGLAAGIFTRDSARSLRMANSIKAGIVWVNSYRAISPISEFGGFKHSGYGREAGLQAIYDYTRSKSVWINTSGKPLESQFVIR